jgi:hypothetical protein
MSDDALNNELKALILSNAKAIQALASDDADAKRERARLYQIMSDLAQSHANLAQSHANLEQSHANLAQSHANLAQAQADNQRLLYRFMEQVEQRQNALEIEQQQWKQRQDDLAEQQQRLIKTQADITEILKFLTNR